MGPKRWTIGEILRTTSDYLKQKGVDSPRLSAEILLAHQLNSDRVNLYLHFEKPLHEAELAGYRALIRRRVAREPIQYITGRQEFWSMDFAVDPRVLIPRPETELLVEKALSLRETGRIPQNEKCRILDLCTGCGAVAVALAREFTDASLWATDISEEAIEVARRNAERHGVEERVRFRQGDLLDPFEGEGLAFHVIASNPPYVASDAFVSLAPEVRDFEPRLALDGREMGFFFLEKIIAAAPEYLESGGWLLLEMDPAQTSTALSRMEETGRYRDLERIKDYSHRYRVVAARKDR